MIHNDAMVFAPPRRFTSILLTHLANLMLLLSHDVGHLLCGEEAMGVKGIETSFCLSFLVASYGSDTVPLS